MSKFESFVNKLKDNKLEKEAQILEQASTIFETDRLKTEKEIIDKYESFIKAGKLSHVAFYNTADWYSKEKGMPPWHALD